MKTLGEYRDFCASMVDENNPAVVFFDKKIKEQGRNELVLTDESQMMILIGSLLNQGR